MEPAAGGVSLPGRAALNAISIQSDMNDTLHLAVTPNDAYAEPLRVLLTSILANNSRNQVHIHIVH